MLATEFINYFSDLLRVPYRLNDTNLRVVARLSLIKGRMDASYSESSQGVELSRATLEGATAFWGMVLNFMMTLVQAATSLHQGLVL